MTFKKEITVKMQFKESSAAFNEYSFFGIDAFLNVESQSQQLWEKIIFFIIRYFKTEYLFYAN